MSWITRYTQWELNHKADFDGINRTITITPSVSEINIQQDIYSDWKEWTRLEKNDRFTRALTAIGGNPLPGGDQVGITFFLENNWKIVIDHAINFTGNLYTADGSSPFITAAANQYISTTQVSTLPEKIAPDLTELNVPTAPQNADAVRSELATELAIIVEDLLKEKRFIALQ